MSFLIKLENISKIYSLGQQSFCALNEINFHLQPGEMTAVMGASGSGKTSLMNIIGFLDRCTEGQYFFADQNVSFLTNQALAEVRNKKIGFVFQSFFLLSRVSALQNVMLPLFYRGLSRYEAKEKAHHMLDKIGLSQFAQHKPNQLSGGQQQRIAIARALVGDPELILADEPTGALDSKTSQEIMDLLVELNHKEHKTIILITHDKEVSQRCERVVMMKDGRMIE